MTVQLDLEVEELDRRITTVTVDVVRLFNFGYAGRDQATVAEHVNELAKLGLPAPATVPAVFALPSDRATAASCIEVTGADSYGEVEYALVANDGDWLVCVASDHSDFAVEKLSTPRSKAMCPDVLSARAWRLADVEAHWDVLELSCERVDDDGTSQVQFDQLAQLLPPREVLEILAKRTGSTVGAGTVILSGTIGGEPVPGGTGWIVRLHDRQLNRTLSSSYTVRALPDELV